MTTLLVRAVLQLHNFELLNEGLGKLKLSALRYLVECFLKGLVRRHGGEITLVQATQMHGFPLNFYRLGRWSLCVERPRGWLLGLQDGLGIGLGNVSEMTSVEMTREKGCIFVLREI